jgi:hypothetical protein
MKDTKELRSFLLNQMNGVAAGTVDMNAAKAVSNLAQQIYNTFNIEIKMAVAKSKIEDEICAVSFGD